MRTRITPNMDTFHSMFFAIFFRRQRKIIYEVQNYWLTSNRDIICCQQQFQRFSFQQYFSSLVVKCPLMCPARTIWLRQYCTSNNMHLWRNEKLPSFRSSRSKMFCLIGSLKTFAKPTEIYMCPSLFFNKVVGLRPLALLRKRLRHRYFPMNFVKLFRTFILQAQTYEEMKYC